MGYVLLLLFFLHNIDSYLMQKFSEHTPLYIIYYFLRQKTIDILVLILNKFIFWEEHMNKL